MRNTILHGLALGSMTTALAVAQGDECVGATAVPIGPTPFDTTGATPSPEPWGCAGGGGADLWFRVTATSSSDLFVETCGSTFDTVLEVSTGQCGALTLVHCSDDDCGLQSRVTLTGVGAGDVFTIRIGGAAGASGAGTLLIGLSAPPLSPRCVETLYASNGGGSPGGAMYFDVTASEATEVGLVLTNYDAAVGSPVGIDIYTTPGTHVGNEANPAAWTLAAQDDGSARSAGLDAPTVLVLGAPFTLDAGVTGVALVSVGDGHRYTNGNGANQLATSADGNLTVELGTASNVAFAGTAFSPRVWNGRLCPAGPRAIGSSYCTAQANSTGLAASISAFGSTTASENDVTLTAFGMPPMQPGIFVASQSQASTQVASGTLCLGGDIIRFQGPWQILQSGSSGAFSLRIDTAGLPAGSPQPILTGETWNFTAWFRDVDPAIGSTANFTDGVSITFR